MAYVFCNHCGHRNPPESAFCSSCGSALDLKGDRTVKYGDVLDVLKACREVGFNNVGLIAQPKKQAGQEG